MGFLYGTAIPVLHAGHTSVIPVLHAGHTSVIPVLLAGHTFVIPVLHAGHTSVIPVLLAGHTFVIPVLHAGHTSVIPVLHAVTPLSYPCSMRVTPLSYSGNLVLHVVYASVILASHSTFSLAPCGQHWRSMAGVSVWGDDLTPGIYLKASHIQVGPVYAVPQMHNKRWWWISPVAGYTVNQRQTILKPLTEHVHSV
jgi:hypothetical protein